MVMVMGSVVLRTVRGTPAAEPGKRREASVALLQDRSSSREATLEESSSDDEEEAAVAEVLRLWL